MLSMLLPLALVMLQPELRVPAFTAYVEPNPEGACVDRNGVSGWTDSTQRLAWYGSFANQGALRAQLVVRLPKGETAKYRLTLGKRSAEATATGGDDPVTLDFGTLSVGKAPSSQSLQLRGLAKSGAEFGRIEALLLSGPAAKGAHFNLTERRNAASVHLGYPTPKGEPITAFYNEVRAETGPIFSFYMACGFHRGYFGMQVNEPGRRSIIFSVWDSGNEGIDRSKVAADDRVQLLAKGPGVFAGGFGNEGTGGHSHLDYPWKTGETYRFLLKAKPEGNKTVYSGYLYFPEKRAWGLIASFCAPKDGGGLRGLHSFNENYVGINGQLQRRALFGPAWYQTADGAWHELLQARFTHDEHGKENRVDYAAGPSGAAFYLSNGGFVGEPIRYGDTFTRRPSGKAPKVVLP